VTTGEDLHMRMRLVRPDGRIARVHMHAVAAPGRRGRTGFVGTLALLPTAASPVTRGGVSDRAAPGPRATAEPRMFHGSATQDPCGCMFTELRRVEQGCRERDERFTLLISALPFPILVADGDRRVIAVNEAFCDTFELSVEPADLIGSDCTMLARPMPGLVDDPAGFATRLDTLLRRRAAVMREEVMLADGRVFERSHIPVAEGDAYRGHLWIYVDVTERRILEAETEGLIAAGMVPYDGRLGGPTPPTADARAGQRGARSADPEPGPTTPRGDARAVVMLARDLRAPLASVVSYVGLLRDGVAGPLSSDQHTLMAVVAAGADAMVEIVSDRVTLPAYLERGPGRGADDDSDPDDEAAEGTDQNPDDARPGSRHADDFHGDDLPAEFADGFPEDLDEDPDGYEGGFDHPDSPPRPRSEDPDVR
ncbi:MAG: PAS domain-containing protein, partial [Frankia sp.]